jgi:hypothetical protein
MKKLILYIIIGLVVVIGGLSLTSFEIEEKVQINAPVGQVWSTIIDFDSYSEWNSQIEYLGGEVKPNGQLHLKLSVEGADAYEFKPNISHWKENKKFAWIGRTGIPRVFDGEHFFELEQINDSTTLVSNREEYRGVMSLIMKTLPMMKTAPVGFQKMNKELKEYVENNK